jgi:hypothetical protein
VRYLLQGKRSIGSAFGLQLTAYSFLWLAGYNVVMPDRRTHRGPHPDDERLFAESELPRLREAMADYVMLMSRGYAQPSTLKLVGDRFELSQRQRVALMRAGCTEEQKGRRASARLPLKRLTGNEIAIDGYNVLITIESALSGGVLIRGIDGCIRDLASVHGTYRHVTETGPAMELVGSVLAGVMVTRALWLLDAPVSNSGRLRKSMQELATSRAWPWMVQLVTSPDAELRRTSDIVATTDSAILDACEQWVDLAGEIIVSRLPGVRVVDLSIA